MLRKGRQFLLHNSRIYMSFLSNTLSLFRSKPSLFLSFNVVRAQRRSNRYQLYSQFWFQPTSSRTIVYRTRAAATFIPPMQLLNSPPFLVGLMLLNLQFSAWCFVDRLFVLLYFVLWSLCWLSFDLRILITPLISSNSCSLLHISELSMKVEQDH